MEAVHYVIILSALNTLLLIVLTVVLVRGGGGREHDRKLARLEAYLQTMDRHMERLEMSLKDEMGKNRQESVRNAQMDRQELSKSLKGSNEAMMNSLSNISMLQKGQLETLSNHLSRLTETNEQKLESMRRTVEEKLKSLQEENGRKLEQMRATVDEKLSATLEKRLGESFKLVSERLEQVYKGLGEMQALASGVGDLKKVLTNIKTRGIWGEIQLGNILEQILTPEQYLCNALTSENGTERVEYAVRLPGRGDDGKEVLLPIDAKFPQEDYQKYVEAYEQGNAALAEEASKQLENRIRLEARHICEKYINPPFTTDFAVMFLPTESLYAEVAKKPGLIAALQENYRVVVAGPATMAAMLNSLSMGFRTLAIQKRSSEVWLLLGAIKTEFGKFGAILEKTRKKLQDASSTIDEAARKTRTIERKLRGVEELPFDQSGAVLGEVAAADSGSGCDPENHGEE